MLASTMLCAFSVVVTMQGWETCGPHEHLIWLSLDVVWLCQVRMLIK